MVIAVVADLFFSARIRETARLLQVECDILRDPAALPARAQEKAPSLVIVDMNVKTGDATAAVRAMKASPSTRAIPIVGYLHDSHDELIAAARAAGCDRVMSRGGLTKRLPELVAGDLEALDAAAPVPPDEPVAG